MEEIFLKAVTISQRPFFVKRNIVADHASGARYLRYRLLRPLLKIYNRLMKARFGKNKPWLSPASIQILNTVLTKDMTGLEYGSGMSTYFFSQKLKTLVSVEHHKDWHDLVSKQLKQNEVKNVNFVFKAAETSEVKADIERRYKLNFDEELTSYHEYYEYLQEFPDNHFDFILIDGRARVECSRRAVGKLKKGGIFMLDNSERVRYRPVHEMMKDWPKITTTTGLTDTTLWFKP